LGGIVYREDGSNFWTFNVMYNLKHAS
jgi:hypothetical protein